MRHHSHVTHSFPRLRALTQRFTAGAPHTFRFVAGQSAVMYLQSDGPLSTQQRLMTLEIRPGAAPRVIFDPAVDLPDAHIPEAELARRERLRESGTGITDFSVDEAGDRFAFALGGRVYAGTVSTGASICLGDSGQCIDPQLDPTGQRVAWVDNGALWISDVSSPDPVCLLAPQEPDHSWGLANFLAAEEFDRTRGYWWSPAGDALLVEHVDEGAVPTWYLADPTTPAARPSSRHYPAVGQTNPLVSLWLVELSGQRHRLDVPAQFCYLVSVNWSNRGPALVVVMDRPQTRARIYALDGHELALLHEDTDPDWVSCLPGTPDWSNSRELITTVHQGDTESIAIDSVPLELPSGNVTALHSVVAQGLVVELAPTPTTRALAFVDHAREVQLLTAATGYTVGVVGAQTAVVSTTDLSVLHWSRYVGTWSPGSPIDPVTTIPDLSMVPPVTLNLTHLTLGPDELQAVIVWPHDHKPGATQLPVVLSPYGGPHAQRVLSVGRMFAQAQWLADQGFAVVIADGRGSPARGPRWERAIKGDFSALPLADQITVLTEVGWQFPSDVDLNRVGITGWSFGGYLAALAVLRRPDIFHCAVAGAPVTDWMLYDSAYTERYLGLPGPDNNAYQQSSLLDDAASLTRPLLLIHGLADDNVYAAHSLQLSGALTAAGRPHSFLPLPNASHMASGVELGESLLNLEADFLRSNLRLGVDS